MRMAIVGVLLAGSIMAAAAHAGPSQFQSATPAPPASENVMGLPGAPTERALRARANLEALLQGRLTTRDLTPQELQDVLDFDRMLRGGTSDDRSFDQQCIDREVSRNGGQPTRLAWEVIRLKCR